MILNRITVLHMKSLTAAAAVLLLLTGCTSTASDNNVELTVVASFYPLEYVAEHVGGDLVNVVPLASPGVEPHDLELSPSNVRQVASADLVLYLSGFQPAVDDALVATKARAFDAATAVQLRASQPDNDRSGEAIDPHFWLDPTLLATYATALGQQFAQLDPGHSATYLSNATTLAASLRDLDTTFTDGLAQCERRDIVTSHEAFAYLAARYDLRQIGVAGVDPETEPSPARLLDIRDLVNTTNTTTIFTESLANTAVADAIARDTGATTAVLDPIESVAQGDDYASVMSRNLDSLRTALDCA